jgi:hypothetical protein
MYKLIILVIASRGRNQRLSNEQYKYTNNLEYIYDKMIIEYWLKMINYTNNNYTNNNKTIKIYLLFGNTDISDLNIPEGNILKFDYKDTFENILRKTIDGLKYINNNFEYEYVLRTNLSTFLILDNLLKILDKLSNNKEVYAGYKIINHKDNYAFISGTSIIYSYNSVKNNILMNYNKLNMKCYSDDSELSILYRKNIIDLNNNILNIIKYINFEDINIDKIINNINKNNIYSIRIKNINRNVDIKLLKDLFKNFYEFNNNANKF